PSGEVTYPDPMRRPAGGRSGSHRRPGKARRCCAPRAFSAAGSTQAESVRRPGLPLRGHCCTLAHVTFFPLGSRRLLPSPLPRPLRFSLGEFDESLGETLSGFVEPPERR